MWVTLYTDASHRAIGGGKGAFAFWAKSEKGRLIRNGLFKTPIKGATWAEMYCILNAISHIKTKWPETTGLHIVTDSVFCIDLFTRKPCHQLEMRKIKYKDELKMFDNLMVGVQLKMKHQKAHTGNATMKQWLNDWCDQSARKAWDGELHFGK